MRVRGMMNDYSQHRVLVTVLFIPERKKRGRKDRANTWVLSESWTETEKLQSLLSSSTHYSPSLICSSPKEGESLLCVHLWHSFQFLHSSLHLTTHPHILWCKGPGRHHLGSSDVEDRADAQEEAPEDGPQLRDKVKLHHFTEVGVVAGGMGFELEKSQTVKKLKWACCMKFDPFICQRCNQCIWKY